MYACHCNYSKVETKYIHFVSFVCAYQCHQPYSFDPTTHSFLLPPLSFLLISLFRRFLTLFWLLVHLLVPMGRIAGPVAGGCSHQFLRHCPALPRHLLEVPKRHLGTFAKRSRSSSTVPNKTSSNLLINHRLRKDEGSDANTTGACTLPYPPAASSESSDVMSRYVYEK